MTSELFRGLGVLVKLPTDEDFLKVKETLTRIGVASHKDQTLYQSCHILHKQGHYSILHFKELFLLDGKQDQTDFTEEDSQRRNTIVSLLDEWGLVRIIGELGEEASMKKIKVVPFREKGDWTLVAKYTVGNKKGN